MTAHKAERSAQIAQARVEVAKCDREIATLRQKSIQAGDKVKRLELAAKIQTLKAERARHNKIIHDRRFAASY